MDIKILGSGCAKCRKLEELVKEVVQELGVNASVDKVENVKEIAKMGVMMTPGLVINGDVKMSGKLLSKAEINKIITTSLAD
jgi:small redox-active disulfide protein 2